MLLWCGHAFKRVLSSSAMKQEDWDGDWLACLLTCSDHPHSLTFLPSTFHVIFQRQTCFSLRVLLACFLLPTHVPRFLTFFSASLCFFLLACPFMHFKRS